LLSIVQELINALNSTNVGYCHWKSNVLLAKSLSGQTDIDLLINRRDASSFNITLNQLGFRSVFIKDLEPFPSVEHFLGLDEKSGLIVHVHAYYRVITGESLAKNYRLPIEEMLLTNTVKVESINVVSKTAELIVFTLRMMLKHTSVVELLFLARGYKHVKDEIRWLLENTSLDDTHELLNRWLPSVDPDLFDKCFDALRSSRPLLQRIILAHRLRSQLKSFTRHSTLRARLTGLKKFSIMAYRRLTHKKKGMVPLTGGLVIAFVGPEATGKSTLIGEISQWLGKYFYIDQIHVGKPKSTAISFIPNQFLPALRFILPEQKSGRVEIRYSADKAGENPQKIFPILFAIRAVLLAYDRRSLLVKAYRKSAGGALVLCDRYPSQRSGFADSPQLLHYPLSKDKYPLKYLLARLERRLYKEIPPPDLVISLHVPMEIAIQRNQIRSKTEPEDYVRLRHAQSSNLVFENTSVHKINTDQPLEKSVHQIKKVIWNML
jgi:thymidylate kinase